MINESTNLTAIVIAIVGGISSFLLNEGEGGWKILTTKIFLAGFAGHLVWLASQEWGISDNWTAILCGISGLIADNLLRFAAIKMEKYIKKHF